MSETMTEHNTHDSVGHEETDAEIGPLVRSAIFLAVITAITAALTVGFYKYLDAREQREKAPRYPLAAGMERPLPPAPRLQTYTFDDIKGLRREEAKLLDHYAWVDKNAGTVRVPVSRAIELLAEKGLPHRAAAAGTTPGAAPQEGARQESAPSVAPPPHVPAPPAPVPH
jgi:hypothetical protein